VLTGIIIGIFIGAPIGFFAAALMTVSSRASEAEESWRVCGACEQNSTGRVDKPPQACHTEGMDTIKLIRAAEAIEALQVAKRFIAITAQSLYRADGLFDGEDHGAYFGNELHKFVRVINAECKRLKDIGESE
jgi:hypothetical protein